MGTFTIKSSTLKRSYEYVDNNVIVRGNYETNASDNSLVSVDGQVSNKDAKETYIGNFYGSPRDGGIDYDLSQMSRADSNKVWDAIDGIEPNLVDNNEE